jgi:hypothetical protein
MLYRQFEGLPEVLSSLSMTMLARGNHQLAKRASCGCDHGWPLLCLM